MNRQSSDRVRPASRARAAWVFVVCLLAFALAAPWAVSAPPDVTDATASLARLPGFKLLRGLQVVASGNGVFGVTMKKADGTPATGLSAYVLKGSAGWHGTVVLSQPASFAMPGTDQVKVNVTNFAVVASEAADSVPLASLPPGLASGFSSFSDPLPLKQGINVFVAGSVDGSGTVGALRRTLGMQSGDVLFTGTVGPAIFLQVVQKGGAAAGSDADDSVSMTLTLPTVVPPPFSMLSAFDRQKFNLEIVTPSLTVAKAKGASTWSVTGAMTANVTAFEQMSMVSASLSVASDRTITISGSAALATPLKPFGVDTVQISALGVDATIGGAGAKDIAISADVKLGASKVSARFAMRSMGHKLKEISAGLSGSLAIPGLGESLTVNDPTVGLMMETKEGFVSGSVTWRNLNATAVVYGRKSPSGVAAFIKLKEDPNASLAKIVPGAPEMKIPKTVAVLSSIAIDDLPLEKLPSAASAMLESIGKKTSDKVKAVQGLTLYTAIKLHDFASDFADGDALVVGGSVGVDHGKPAFSLSADFPDFKMPDGVKKLGLSSAKPSLYVSLSSKPELQVGVALDLGLKDGNQDILLTGKIYAVVGTSGVGVKVAGFLKSDWDHPFGLDGITLKAPMGMQFSVMADGSVAMLVDGGAQFNSNVNRGPCGSPEAEWCTTIRLGGGFGILFSSGLPTIKGVALRVSMSQLDLLTPVKIGQTIIHAAAGVADKLVTKIEGGTRKGLPPEMKTALGTVKNADIVGVIDGLIPSTGAARDLASVKLKDAEIFLATPGMDAGADFPDLDDVGFRLKGTLLLKDKEIVKVDNYLTMKKGFQILVQPGESIANFAVGPLAITTPSIDVGAPIPGLGGELPHFKVSGAATLKGVNLVSVDVSLSKTDVHVKAGAGFNSCAPLPESRLRPGAEIYLRGASGHLLRMNGNRLDGSGPFTAMSDVPASYTTERWRVVEAGGGEIALYNPTHGRYLRVHDAIVDAGAKVAGGWERFEAIVRGDAVVLHNKHTKRYLSFAAGSLASVADGAAPSSVAGFQIYELSWRADPLSALAQRATNAAQTAVFESTYAAATPANDTPCGTWGANAAIDGKMLSLTSFSLYGTGRFDPPPVLANVGFPTAGATFKLDSATGAAFSAAVHWDAARFDLSGQFKSLQDWNMTGRAHVDGGSKDFWLDNTKVASLTVGPTDLSLAIGANADATLTASGSGNIDIIGVKNVAWNFSGKLSLDHEIKTTIQLPDIYGKKYTACPSDYTTFPVTCTRPADIFARTLGPCDPGYRTDPLTCWRDAHIYGNGCSGKCDAGYHNDGCTCRRDAHSYARSMGPCPAGYATDPATCRRDISTIPRPYEACRSGYHDDGATCRGSKNYDIAFNIFP